MSHLRVLMVGGVAPWHPQAGGGQVVAYKLAEALSRAHQELHYVAVAPERYRRRVNWDRFAYASRQPGLISSVVPALRSLNGNQLADLLHVHTANETSAHCAAYAMYRLVRRKPALIVSVHSPKVYTLPRSLGEASWALSCHAAELILCVSTFSRADVSRAWGIASSSLLYREGQEEPYRSLHLWIDVLPEGEVPTTPP